MALKIEFSAQFKDAQMVEGAIKSLQKQLIDLGKVGAGASNEINKSFTGLSASLQKIQDIAKGAGNLKELTNQVDTLAKLGTNVQAFSRSFDSLGKSINASLGGASQATFKQMKAGIEDITRSIQEQKKEYAHLEKGMPFIKDKYGEDSPFYQSKLALQQGRASSIAQSEAMEKNAQWQASMHQPRGFLGGGSFATTAGMFQTGAAGMYGIGEGAWQVGTMSMRSDVAMRRLRMQAGEQAAQGDPSQVIMQGLGVGIEHGGMSTAKAGAYGAEVGKEMLKYAAIIGAGLLTGGLGALAVGGGLAATTGFRGAGNIGADAQSRMRGMDSEYYEKSFAPAYGAYQANVGAFGDMYRMAGDYSGNAMTGAMMRGGLSRSVLTKSLGAATYYGKAVNDNAGDLMMLDSVRGFGLTDQGQSEMARLSRIRGSAATVNALSGFLGGTTAGRDINSRRVLTDAAFGNLSGMGNQADLGQAGALIQAASKGVAATGMYTSEYGGINVEGAKVAVSAAAGIQSQMVDPNNVVHAMYDMKLLSMGVTEIGTRQALISAISKTGMTDQIVGVISRITKMAPDEIRAAFSGTGKMIAETRAKSLGVNSPQAKIAAAGGISVGGFMTTNNPFSGEFEAAQATLPTLGDKSTMAAGGQRYQDIGADTVSRGEARKQGEEIGAWQEIGDTYSKDLYKSIYSAIGDALQNTGKEISDKVREATNKDKSNESFLSDSTVNSMRTFFGTKNNFEDKK